MKGVVAALSAGYLVVVEFLFGFEIAKAVVFQAVMQVSPASAELVALLVGSVAIIAWMGKRAAGLFSLKGPYDYLDKVGLKRVQISRVACVVAAMHVAGTVLLYVLQKQLGYPILSLEGYFHDGSIEWTRIIRIIVAAPVTEELVFRGILVSIFSMYASEAPVLFRTMLKVLGPGLLFASIHLINFIGHNFTSVYILAQIGVALLFGIFYSQRFILTNTLWEPIFLHVTNNICSKYDALRLYSSTSFVRTDDAFSFSNPLVLYPCTYTSRVLSFNRPANSVCVQLPRLSRLVRLSGPVREERVNVYCQ